jgi:hypothetical protein
MCSTLAPLVRHRDTKVTCGADKSSLSPDPGPLIQACALLVLAAMAHPQQTTIWSSILDHNSEAIVGRTAAACARPLAAWRMLSGSWRALVLLTYASVSYLVVLGILLAIKPA